MHAPQHDQSSKRRRVRESKSRTKRPAGEIPPLHPHALYRPGRLCVLFDVDRSTLAKWRKQGLLPPFTKIAGVEGLTGQQILDFYATQQQRKERSDV
jgi:hypothetical protein